jgi:hypothetical protein
MKIVYKKIFKRDENWFLPVELISDGSKTTMDLLVNKDFDDKKIKVKHLGSLEDLKADERDVILKQIRGQSV